MVGSWIDRFGNTQTYFSGSSGSHVCDCASSFMNECYQLPYQKGHLSRCNCDARDPVLRNDEGILMNKVLNNMRLELLAFLKVFNHVKYF